jgi:hypothetical protein
MLSRVFLVPRRGVSGIAKVTESLSVAPSTQTLTNPLAHSSALPGDIPIDVSPLDILSAAHRIRQGSHAIKRTSMYHSRRLSSLLGMEIYLKHEFSHPTGSFKERGA